MRITPETSRTNCKPCVGKVPADGGRIRLRASDPAMASAGMTIRKRPISIAKASVVL